MWYGKKKKYVSAVAEFFLSAEDVTEGRYTAQKNAGKPDTGKGIGKGSKNIRTRKMEKIHAAMQENDVVKGKKKAQVSS